MGAGRPGGGSGASPSAAKSRRTACGSVTVPRIRVVTGALDADQLLRRYCTLVYAETGSYSETARRLGLDRRTTRLKVDPVWLAVLRGTVTASPDGEGPRCATDRRAPGTGRPRREQ